MLEDTIGRAGYQFEAASFHQPVASHSECRNHKPFHLDVAGYYDLDRRRKHAELVDFSIRRREKNALRVRNIYSALKKDRL